MTTAIRSPVTAATIRFLPNRPAMDLDDNGVLDANTPTTNPNLRGDPPTATADGADVIDGGEDYMHGDTISYEGEAATPGVTVNLNTLDDQGMSRLVPDNAGTENVDESDPPRILVGLTGDLEDAIIVKNQGTKDEPVWVSTIENIIGGFGSDVLTGDSRVNRIEGGAGADTLDGGGGNDVIVGSDGVADTGLNGGKGSDMIYADHLDGTIDGGEGTADEDDMDTMDVDESSSGDTDVLSYAMVTKSTDANDPPEPDQGVTKSLTGGISNIENLTGSPLNDSLTGDAQANTIMGGAGDDNLGGAGGKDTLNGGPGEDNVAGGTFTVADGVTTGTSDTATDIFVVFSGEGPDTILDYEIDDAMTADELEGDEIHLKNFGSGATPDVVIVDASTVTVSVGDTVVLNVKSAEAVDKVKADLEKEGKIVFFETETN